MFVPDSSQIVPPALTRACAAVMVLNGAACVPALLSEPFGPTQKSFPWSTRRRCRSCRVVPAGAGRAAGAAAHRSRRRLRRRRPCVPAAARRAAARARGPAAARRAGRPAVAPLPRRCRAGPVAAVPAAPVPPLPAVDPAVPPRAGRAGRARRAREPSCPRCPCRARASPLPAAAAAVTRAGAAVATCAHRRRRQPPARQPTTPGTAATKTARPWRTELKRSQLRLRCLGATRLAAAPLERLANVR